MVIGDWWLVIGYWLNMAIFEKDSAVREAPPTNAPSISGHAISAATESAVTEPPVFFVLRKEW